MSRPGRAPLVVALAVALLAFGPAVAAPPRPRDPGGASGLFAISLDVAGVEASGLLLSGGSLQLVLGGESRSMSWYAVASGFVGRTDEGLSGGAVRTGFGMSGRRDWFRGGAVQTWGLLIVARPSANGSSQLVVPVVGLEVPATFDLVRLGRGELFVEGRFTVELILASVANPLLPGVNVGFGVRL